MAVRNRRNMVVSSFAQLLPTLLVAIGASAMTPNGPNDVLQVDPPKVSLVQERRLKKVFRTILGPGPTPELYVYHFVTIPTQFIPSSDKVMTVAGQALDRFTFTCTAPFMTRWTSNILPQLPSKYSHPSRKDHIPNIYTHTSKESMEPPLEIYESTLTLELPSGKSGHVQCESLIDSPIQLSTRIFIFSLDGPNLVHSEHPIIVMDTRQNFLLPCIANYPNVTALLDRFSDENGNIDDYDPRVGFLVGGHGGRNDGRTCIYKGESVTWFYFNPDIPFQIYDLIFEVTVNDTLNFHIGGLFDEYPLGIHCSSVSHPVHEIRMINCRSKDECGWLRPCLFNNCTENRIIQKIAIPMVLDHVLEKSSGIIPDPYTYGIVYCKHIQNSVVQDYNYLFTGLDRQRYWLLKSSEIPNNAIIQLNEIQAVLYTNEEATFVCESINFLLISQLRFAMEFTFGSFSIVDQTQLYKDNYTNADQTPSSLNSESSKQNSGILVDDILGFSRKQWTMNVTKEMVRIFCFAPWNNSTQWINTSRSFQVRDVEPPRIATLDSNDTVFFVGDSTRSLFCNVSGEPRPQVEWIIPQALTSKFEAAGIVIEDTSTLQLPKIDPVFRGNWKFTCTAKNNYGKASKDFHVSIKDADTYLGPTNIAGISVALFLFLCLTIGLAIAIRKFINAKKLLRNLTPEEIEEFRKGNPQLLAQANSEGQDKVRWLGFSSSLEIRESDLVIGRKATMKNSILGEGQFGRVYRGFLRDEAVAVKAMKSCVDVSYLKAFLSELKVMAYIGAHAHVVLFRGAVISRIHERIVYAVTEISSMGCLKTFLRQIGSDFENMLGSDGSIDTASIIANNSPDFRKTISTLHFIHWCEQIASAMTFISSKQVIHGDLATRNILLFKNNVVKLTDFGLSRQLYGYEKYVRKQKIAMPWAWMSIESLRFREFSSQSDVWSFGVTLWEIFTFAQVPFAGLRWGQDFENQLVGGLRLQKPEYSPSVVYQKMEDCWKLEPNLRPTFPQLLTFFEDLMITHISRNVEGVWGELQRKSWSDPEPVVYTTL